MIFREIVGNLIVHREYTNAISSELIIYSNKVVTSNPNRALFHGPLDLDQFNPYPKSPNIRKFFTAFGCTDEIGSGVRNTTKYLSIYANGARPVFIENDIFSTEIPLSVVTLAIYYQNVSFWFDLSPEIETYLKENLYSVPLDIEFSCVPWDQLILHLVSSWDQIGTKLNPLDWPKKQVSQPEDIKKVSSWDQNGTKVLQRKVSYLIRILLFTLGPTSLDQLMSRLGYSTR